MKNKPGKKPGKKKDFSVLIPAILVIVMLAFIAGGLIYNAVTGGPEPLAESYLEWMMDRDGIQVMNGYHPSILTYAAKTTGEKTSAIAQRAQSRIETWYDSKIFSVCGAVSSYETELLSVEDAGEDAIRDLEVMTGLEVSDAVICKGRITALGDKGQATSDQTVYLMKIDDAWYLYGLGLLV
jgi:hypothetical protein